MGATDEETKPTFDAAQLIQTFARPVLNFVFAAIPPVIQACQKGYSVYCQLPLNHVQLLIGAVMCFFGGFYPTLFAALQAANHGGLRTLQESLKALSQEATIIIHENEKDNTTDDDGDGIADADQMDGRELVKRKFKLVLTKMNPEKVNVAIVSIYKVWLSVLAVLTIEFARTIALALTISEFSKKFADKRILPTVTKAVPQEYEKWCPVLVDWFCKSIGISIAWRMQAVISAFASALAGGLMMSRAALQIVSEGGNNDQDTKVDEIAAYAFAGVGFYFQYNSNFSAPFPLNIILWPVELADYCILWAVTKA